MTLKLSVRLLALAACIPQNSRVADIGSDHALLPCFLAGREQCEYAVAGEINEGPYQAAKSQVRSLGLERKVFVRKGDGLSVIAPGEVDVVTIAGMGGSLIANILQNGMKKLQGVRQLVLQPNVAEDRVREWLLANGWFLTDEQILEDEGKIYEIIVAKSAENAPQLNDQLIEEAKLCTERALSRELLLSMGPRLLLNPNDVFFRKWRSEISKLENILTRMNRSAAAETEHKKVAYSRKITEITEVLACLQKVKP